MMKAIHSSETPALTRVNWQRGFKKLKATITGRVPKEKKLHTAIRLGNEEFKVSKRLEF
jgi:hypothetical protein